MTKCLNLHGDYVDKQFTVGKNVLQKTYILETFKLLYTQSVLTFRTRYLKIFTDVSKGA